MDAALEEAARVSGSSNFQTLWRITVPVLAPALVASTFLAFIKSLESFEIELVLGVPAQIYVLSTKIYDFIYWEPPLFGPATALSTIFLFVIFVLVWMQRFYLRGRQYMTVTGRGYTVRPFTLGKWRWLTFGVCALFIGVVICLPLVALVIGTFMKFFGNFNVKDPWTLEHWRGVFHDPIFFRSLVNTFTLGTAAAIIGSIIYTLVSYFIIRTRSAGRQLIDFLSWLPWAMPGILISLALLWTILGSGSVVRLIYGTMWVLVLAIIIKEMPVGVQVMKAGLMQISDELEEASMVSGSSWVSTYRRILLPLLKPTMIAVGIVVLMSAIRDIATIIFLATATTRTTSLLMLDYMAEANMERAAVVAVVIVGLIFCLLFLGRLVGIRHVSTQP
jgi:iron(III) transport system permease protein